MATRRGADSVHLTDFTNAVERIVAARTGPGLQDSIIPRGIGALGYTIQRPTEDRFLMTEEELKNRMAVLLGGRAAEYIFFPASFDRRRGRSCEGHRYDAQHGAALGMDKKLGHVAYERERPATPGTPVPQVREFSDETERLMDHAVRDLVGHAFDQATEILNAHRVVHEKTAQLLLQQETLKEKDIAALRVQIVPAAGANRGDAA